MGQRYITGSVLKLPSHLQQRDASYDALCVSFLLFRWRLYYKESSLAINLLLHLLIDIVTSSQFLKPMGSDLPLAIYFHAPITVALASAHFFKPVTATGHISTII